MKIFDPSTVVNLNSASIAAAVRGVVACADGPSRAQKAVNRALDAMTSDPGSRELLMIAFREMFDYGRTSAMRAAHHQREQRRNMQRSEQENTQ